MDCCMYTAKFWIARICAFARESGLRIDPLPEIRLAGTDEFPNGEGDVLATTGFYVPGAGKLVVTAANRHLKDVLRSFCHELIHHVQWLENPNYVQRIFNSETVTGNPEVEELEKDAYLRGNLLIRKFTESLKRKGARK